MLLASLILMPTPTGRKARATVYILLVLTVTLLVLGSMAGTACAASGAQAFQNGGTNVGNALMAWGRALLFSMGAIMGIGALIKRSVGEGVTILIIVLILGAFLYDQSDTENVIRNLWGAIGG
jgi:hypothetical protein